MQQSEMIALVKAAASRHQLEPAILCGLIEQESSWVPWCYRYESEFRTRYVAPMHLLIEEEIARSFSWGLCQVMGQVAREQGFTGRYFSELCDPATGIEYGCRTFLSKLAAHAGNIQSALLAYNGGSNPNYAQEVMQKSNYYKNSGQAA